VRLCTHRHIFVVLPRMCRSHGVGVGGLHRDIVDMSNVDDWMEERRTKMLMELQRLLILQQQISAVVGRASLPSL